MCSSSVTIKTGNLSFTLIHNCKNTPSASRALYGAMDNTVGIDNAATRDMPSCNMNQSASTAIAGIIPAGNDITWTYSILPQTECGCAQVLNATHITKTCFTYALMWPSHVALTLMDCSITF